MQWGKLKERNSGHADKTTWLGDSATNPGGSDNLLTEVCALISRESSQFWMQRIIALEGRVGDFLTAGNSGGRGRAQPKKLRAQPPLSLLRLLN